VVPELHEAVGPRLRAIEDQWMLALDAREQPDPGTEDDRTEIVRSSIRRAARNCRITSPPST